MMTRKDYQATAKILKGFISQTNDGTRQTAVDEYEQLLVNRFIAMFENDNKNFNPDVFWDACFDDQIML